MEESSFDMSSEKNRQNVYLYQKIKPKNIEIAKNLVLDYDLSNSILKIIKTNYNDYEKLKQAIQEHFIKREAYLKSLCHTL